MDRFEKDELNDAELDRLLPAWKAPAAPARLKAAVFPAAASPWWQRLWTTSIRVPLPVACALLALLVFVVLHANRPAPPPPHAADGASQAVAWRPVRELQPRIIRRPQ